MRVPLLFSWFMSLSLAQDYDYVSECPTDNGFFADALQCDRYYECKNGQVGLTGVNILPFSWIIIREKFLKS